MGKKIESIIKMHQLGLPAPGCVFVMENDCLKLKFDEYFTKYNNSEGIYTVRTDTVKSSMSCKCILSATLAETIYYTTLWHKEGFQVILQEFIDERNEIKSGNIWLKNSQIIIEGAIDKHINFTNGESLDINLICPRFDSFSYYLHKFFTYQNCFTQSEIFRLIRLARKIPYTNAIIEFSFFNDGKLYFWEIKTEKTLIRRGVK